MGVHCLVHPNVRKIQVNCDVGLDAWMLDWIQVNRDVGLDRLGLDT